LNEQTITVFDATIPLIRGEGNRFKSFFDANVGKASGKLHLLIFE